MSFTAPLSTELWDNVAQAVTKPETLYLHVVYKQARSWIGKAPERPAKGVPDELSAWFLVLSSLCLSREVYNEILHAEFFSSSPTG